MFRRSWESAEMASAYRAAVSALAAIGLLLAPSAARAGAWLKPVPLNLSDGSGPSVGLDATGNVVAAWQTNPGGTVAGVIQGAHHVVGGTGFAQLPDFSTDTAMNHNNGSPVVVMNASGNGLVVWVNDLSGGNHQIQVRALLPNGDVGPVESIPMSAPMGSYANPVAAINDNGDAVVAWQHGTAVEAVTRQALSGMFTNVATPDQLEAVSNSAPSVAIDAAGNAIAVWPVGGTIHAKRHPAGGAWTATTDTPLTTAGHTYSAPDVAANASGQMVVAFVDSDGSNTFIGATTGTVAAGWGPSPAVTTLSGPGVNHGPGVNVDDNGGAAVGWSMPSAVQVSLRPAHGSFPAPAGAQSVLPVPSNTNNFSLAGNGRGATVVSWWTFDVGALQNVVRAAVKPAGSNTFTASQIVSDPTIYSSSPVIALDQNGDAVVAYTLGTPSGAALAVFDGAGPLLGPATGPAKIARGRSATFSVAQPLDAFSKVSSLSWSFGDGSAVASGAQVSHSFGAPGTFTVTVTATDAVGNTSSSSTMVAVTDSSHCVVPKLKGKTLSQAKSLLKTFRCSLGKVTKPKPRKHHKLGKLIVQRSSPGAGAVKPIGTKVGLTLVEAPSKHH
jgi:PKD domain-containing protein